MGRDPDLSELPILICTGDAKAVGELEEAVADMRRVATITKPFDIDELVSTLAELLERQPA